jgi:hypothetical protein
MTSFMLSHSFYVLFP